MSKMAESDSMNNKSVIWTSEVHHKTLLPRRPPNTQQRRTKWALRVNSEAKVELGFLGEANTPMPRSEVMNRL